VQVNVEKPSPNVAKVSLSVPAEDFQKHYKQGIQHQRGQVSMKGFRPGKAPLPMVEKQFGEEITANIQQHFIQQAYSQAVHENDLKPFSHPQINKDDAQLSEDGSFSVEFEVALKPTFELPDYKGLEVESELNPVLPENVDSAIEEIKLQQSRPEPAADGMEAGGMALGDVAFLHGETSVFDREGIRISDGTPPPGVDGEAFTEALQGSKDGDVVEVPMTLPDTLEQEDARGAEGICRVTVKQAYNMIPPTEEELFGMLQVEDEASLMIKVKEKLEENHQTQENGRIETVLLQRLMDETEVDLPDTMLEDQTTQRLNALHGQLEEQGLDHDAIHTQMEQQRPVAREESEKGLKALLVVEQLAETEDLQVRAEEMETELESIAMRNGADIDEVKKYYSENNMHQQLGIELLERKVREFLRENATVKEPT
jgi:trigger factor